MTIETAVLVVGLLIGSGGIGALIVSRRQAGKLEAETEKIKGELERELWDRVQAEMGRMSKEIDILREALAQERDARRALQSAFDALKAENERLRKGGL